MVVPKASEDFHGYHAWRRALVPLEVGTIIQWVDPKVQSGSTMASDIKQGQCFFIANVRDPILHSGKQYDCDRVYQLRLCTKNGKLFTRSEYWSVEGVARWLENGQAIIL